MNKLNSETNPTAYKKLRRIAVSRKTGACDRCPPHGGENARRKPRSDRHKNHR